jgi:hypothetical protein
LEVVMASRIVGKLNGAPAVYDMEKGEYWDLVSGLKIGKQDALNKHFVPDEGEPAFPFAEKSPSGKGGSASPFTPPKPKTSSPGRIVGKINGAPAVYDTEKGEYWDLVSGLKIGRQDALNKHFVPDAGEPEFSFVQQPSVAPSKPKFSSTRAKQFSDAAGYVYAVDPETRVVKILKAPPENKKAEGVLLAGGGAGKNKTAYDAIWGKYGEKAIQMHGSTPSGVDVDGSDDVDVEESTPPATTAPPMMASRAGGKRTSFINDEW